MEVLFICISVFEQILMKVKFNVIYFWIISI